MISVIECTEKFECLKSEWTKLLLKSNANDLFMSWEWLFSWWQVWGNQERDSLFIIVITRKKSIIGIVPLMLSNSLSIPYFGGKRLQFIGSHWKHIPSVRTEYFSPIFDMEFETESQLEFNNYLSSLNVYDEICICDSINCDFMTFEDISTVNKTKNFKHWQQENSYFVDTTLDFIEYKASLGRNTRKKYFNDQRKLDELDVTNNSNEFDFINVCNYFNSFHLTRWSNKVFNRKVIAFYTILFKTSDQLQPKFYYLKTPSNKVLSIVFCIQSSTTLYYIQSGFQKNHLPFALGKLHLGLVIQDAFFDSRVDKLNLLAGGGKSSNYKQFLTERFDTFKTFSILKTQKAKISHHVIGSIRSIKKYVTKSFS